MSAALDYSADAFEATAATALKVLLLRVDGLVLRYRMTLDPAFLQALRESGAVAYRHGRAGFYWHSPEREPSADEPEARSAARRLRERWDTKRTREVWGELRYSRANKKWVIHNHPCFTIVVDHQAGGQTEHRTSDEIGDRVVSDDGFALTIDFAAQRLAEIGLDAALIEAEAIAALCGVVHEQRLGRIDLCADVQGWTIGEDDVKRLVKRPRARWQKEYGDVPELSCPVAIDDRGRVELLRVKKGGRASKVEHEEEIRAQDYGRGALERRKITGLSVGRGGAMMSRIYDKRCELERDEERRVNEEARWTAGGWDGVTNVTRVEFQIRGSVIREFGIQDPTAVKDVEWGINPRTQRPCVVSQKVAVDEDGVPLTLADRLDWLWRSCLDWVRLIEPETTRTGKAKRVGLLGEDERWSILRTVSFRTARGPSVIKRFRVRSVASAAMGLGVALSQAGKDGTLYLCAEHDKKTGFYECSDDEALTLLQERVRVVYDEARERAIEMLLKRGEGAIGGLKHLAVRNNAAFFKHLRRGTDADHATDPPHGDRPGPASTTRRRWIYSTGSRGAGGADP